MIPVLVYVLVVTSTVWPANGAPAISSFVVDNIVTQDECMALGAKIEAAAPVPVSYQCYPVTKAK